VDPSGWINNVVLRCSKLARGSKRARELILVAGLILHVPWLWGKVQTSWIPSTRAATRKFWGQGCTLLEVSGSNLDQLNLCPTDFCRDFFFFALLSRNFRGSASTCNYATTAFFPTSFPFCYSSGVPLFETIAYSAKFRRHWVILVDKQLDAQFLLWYVYLNPLHVSSNYVPILRRAIVWIQFLV